MFLRVGSVCQGTCLQPDRLLQDPHRATWRQKPLAEARSGHDPKQVETILAEVEGQSKRYIDEMLGGDFPLQPEARYRLSMYVAVQMTPG
jgi:hypothetical protein